MLKFPTGGVGIGIGRDPRAQGGRIIEYAPPPFESRQPIVPMGAGLPGWVRPPGPALSPGALQEGPGGAPSVWNFDPFDITPQLARGEPPYYGPTIIEGDQGDLWMNGGVGPPGPPGEAGRRGIAELRDAVLPARWIMVAGADAPAWAKRAAQYVCTGADDQNIFNAACVEAAGWRGAAPIAAQARTPNYAVVVIGTIRIRDLCLVGYSAAGVAGGLPPVSVLGLWGAPVFEAYDWQGGAVTDFMFEVDGSGLYAAGGGYNDMVRFENLQFQCADLCNGPRFRKFAWSHTVRNIHVCKPHNVGFVSGSDTNGGMYQCDIANIRIESCGGIAAHFRTLNGTTVRNIDVRARDGNNAASIPVEYGGAGGLCGVRIYGSSTGRVTQVLFGSNGNNVADSPCVLLQGCDNFILDGVYAETTAGSAIGQELVRLKSCENVTVRGGWFNLSALAAAADAGDSGVVIENTCKRIHVQDFAVKKVGGYAVKNEGAIGCSYDNIRDGNQAGAGNDTTALISDTSTMSYRDGQPMGWYPLPQDDATPDSRPDSTPYPLRSCNTTGALDITDFDNHHPANVTARAQELWVRCDGNVTFKHENGGAGNGPIFLLSEEDDTPDDKAIKHFLLIGDIWYETLAESETTTALTGIALSVVRRFDISAYGSQLIDLDTNDWRDRIICWWVSWDVEGAGFGDPYLHNQLGVTTVDSGFGPGAVALITQVCEGGDQFDLAVSGTDGRLFITLTDNGGNDHVALRVQATQDFGDGQP